MSNIPVYWKTRLDEVEETLKLVKKGKVTRPNVSAGGRPIYVVEYGQSNLPPHKANCSSALGARDIKYYADKSGADYNPTVFLCGCVHGGEFEGTVAILNMIKLIETGTDYRGERNDELVSLAEKAHLVLIPMCNPDGRSHIPFDTYVGRTFYDLRYYNQGTWKDGTLTGWPGCKAVTPIKDYVDYLGGYFNDDGVNMMHENFFGKVSNETRVLLDIAAAEAPDFTVLLHGGGNTTNGMLDNDYGSLKSKKEILLVNELVAEACAKEGVRGRAYPISKGEERDMPCSFNLPSAMHHCCSEPVTTYESNQGLTDQEGKIYDHDEIYAAHMILFREIIRYELKKFGKID